MIKSLPWMILGGITLIAAVVVIEVLGTILYLQSPDRVVRGSFAHLLNAKSFHITLDAADDAPNGHSFKVDGALDKQQLSKPTADLNFSFQTAGHSFYGMGEARAKDGEIYLRFDQIVGIPGVLPEALQKIWADLNMNALLIVGGDSLFPQATGNFTEADLQAIRAIALKHIPFRPTSKGDSGHIDLTSVMHYKVELDRNELAALIGEIRSAIKGSALTSAENMDIAKTVADLPPVTGEVWISRNDGTMVAAVATVKEKDSSFRLNIRLSRYDQPVASEVPQNSKPLIDLVRQLTGPTLSANSIKLPFQIPVPIYDIDQKIPSIPGAAANGQGKALGELPNLIRLFYGTDTLFAPLKK